MLALIFKMNVHNCEPISKLKSVVKYPKPEASKLTQNLGNTALTLATGRNGYLLLAVATDSCSRRLKLYEKREAKGLDHIHFRIMGRCTKECKLVTLCCFCSLLLKFQFIEVLQSRAIRQRRGILHSLFSLLLS